ncbi:MAG TPA: alpha-amylase family glycosyl hydrolase, partial [Candidatus Ozemobacteraceae bacterium]|nr:alpha-amylase family glycosyl hydrolase [Candidatus Ozemobacteraceae bacterium]
MTEQTWLQKTIRNVLVGGMTACWLMSATVAWSAGEPPILDRLNQLARDIHMSQKAVSGSGNQSHESAGAFAKEAATAADLQKAIFRVNTVDEAVAARETIQKFGYRVTSTAERKAYQQAMNLLESRLKFLAQSESREFVPVVQSLEPLNKEIERLSFSVESGPGSRVKTIAAQADRARSASRTDVAGRLGFEVKNGKTSFAVSAPDATSVNLVLFNKPEEKTGAGYAMKKDAAGVWRCSIDGELYGKYYGFAADGPNTPGFLFDPKRLLSDPCALANVDHDGKSIVVKTDFTWTDKGFKPPSAKDVIIYEAHVKDLTAHPSSGVPADLRGKYLGILEGQVLNHLKDIGVNAVEFLPLQEFDNNFAGHMNHWGYMTTHLRAPETACATGKKGEAVKEFKQMVNGLHNAGIAVIMDVVYNHTGEGNEKGMPLNFKGLDNPGYYRLCDDKRFYWNGTGCGNEFRSDHPVTRRYIVDSLKYWSKEYHIDGFRFDLGTILDKDTMTAIMNELPADTIIVAEPWAADWKRNQWGKSDFRNTKLGKWNDDFREKIREFVKGHGNRNDVMTVLAGSCFWW